MSVRISAGALSLLGDIMVNSNIEPIVIQPDFGTLKNGKLDILVNWDITPLTKSDAMNNEYTEWSYESVRMSWILPEPYTTTEEIQQYFNDNYDQGENILNWAKATKVNNQRLKSLACTSISPKSRVQ